MCAEYNFYHKLLISKFSTMYSGNLSQIVTPNIWDNEVQFFTPLNHLLKKDYNKTYSLKKFFKQFSAWFWRNFLSKCNNIPLYMKLIMSKKVRKEETK